MIEERVVLTIIACLKIGLAFVPRPVNWPFQKLPEPTFWELAMLAVCFKVAF